MTYTDQIRNLCIQTYYNLFGVMPSQEELDEMVGEPKQMKLAA